MSDDEEAMRAIPLQEVVLLREPIKWNRELMRETLHRMDGRTTHRRITAAEARELVEKATPGPWHYGGGRLHEHVVYSHECSIVADCVDAADGRLIVAAPDLAASLIAAEGELVWLRKLWRLQDRVIGALHLIDSNHAEGDDAGAKHAGELYEECVGELADFENENTEAIKVLREAVK